MRTAFFRWRGGDAGCRCQWQKKRDERGAAVKISSVRRKAARKFGAPQQGHRPLWRVYKRCGWTWHTVYTYITHIHPQNHRKVCRLRAAKNSNHFSLRHMWGKKYLSDSQCEILSLAAKLCVQQTANPFGRKFCRNFCQQKKRRPRASLFAISM